MDKSYTDKFAEHQELEDEKIIKAILYIIGLYVCFQAGYCMGFLGR